MRLFLASLALALAACALPEAMWSQSAAGARPAPCARPEHRQFDFWIGEWDVTLPNGRTAGVNHIRPIHGGCALQEEWVGAGGATGTSLNAFDAATGRWHQTWVGSDGLLLQLDGGMKDGAMELVGVTVGANGARTLQRIRWTPLGGTPARVRQLWETSSDDGRTWSVAFDGLYRRKG
ncbi:MAG: hypothetical protein ABR499_13305 [Gemmatimonadaceae bacterium]